MIYTLSDRNDITRDAQEPTRWPGGLMLTGNARAHLWRVALYDGGVPIDLNGMTAVAKFRRSADDVTVVQAAAISGNEISVQLAQDCYRYAGQLKGMLEVTGGEGDEAVVLTAKVTYFDILAGAGDQLSDPENMIPSMGEIVARMEEMEQLALDAEDAAESANDAAETADAAAGSANTAAGAANTAAGNAQAQADALASIAAEAETLDAGSTATAQITADAGDGHKIIQIGVPRGNTGDKGERGTLPWYGTAITGNSSEPAAYATGLPLVNAGDIYLYTGSDSASVGNEYICTLGGDATTALWVYLRNSQGVPGAGNVSYVDGQSPDADGNVALNAASRVAAATAGDFASLDSEGNLTDSGHKHSDYASSGQGEKADNAVSFSIDQSARTDAEKARARSNILAASVQELLEKTGYGIYSGLDVAAQAAPNMTVTIPVGIAYLPDGTRVTPATVAVLAVNAANATLDRIDIVYVSSAGVTSYLAGTAAASPEAPAVPNDGLLIAEIMVGAGVTTITDDDISHDGVQYIIS
ncbi:MAG: hypothetical protein PHY64_00985, partial [Eubacteriales bacterium]|nr:hypothetical protein [Eubacteriales bacterium]